MPKSVRGQQAIFVRNNVVDEIFGNNDSKPDGRLSDSIAVGSIQFSERIKRAMGPMARGRTIRRI